ncbi:murein L,D-transpeptidase catalytic domain family protein [Fibrella sp. WM1]|uniref:murein L,D-transpeptidase catalytic domain family protein n=1 Tax=Fibrella musci TaxID=3242485 RepID=UPI003522DAA9
MKLFLLPILALFCCGTAPLRQPETTAKPTRTCTTSADPRMHLYDDLDLELLGLNRRAYELGVTGMQYVNKPKPLLLLADMTQPSVNKRLYVIDVANRKLLFQTYVAHGQGSGTLRPRQFSNVASSMQSSLGFYRTMGRYWGKHGLSLKLKGLEPGINDRVFDRNIVLHGAAYVCEDTIRYTGMLGRSQGCPAVPDALSTPIIKTVEGGATLFVYYPDSRYLATSSFINGKREPVTVASR